MLTPYQRDHSSSFSDSVYFYLFIFAIVACTFVVRSKMSLPRQMSVNFYSMCVLEILWSQVLCLHLFFKN